MGLIIKNKNKEYINNKKLIRTYLDHETLIEMPPRI
jgi:hypothetical protein